MFTIILSFLKAHLQAVLIASGAVSVLATILLQHLEVTHLKNKLALCHAESATLEASNKALLASVEEQNAAVAGLQKNAQSRKAGAARAMAAARLNAGKYAAQAKAIEGQAVTKDDCADLRKLVNDFAGRPGGY